MPRERDRVGLAVLVVLCVLAVVYAIAGLNGFYFNCC
jgi:hypothetical protein